MSEKKKSKIDWIIHFVANGVECQTCGKTENRFPQYMCDAHTHGMTKYGHPEFQLVVNYGMQETGRLLNTMGLRVQAGEIFKSGDKVKGLYEDCDITLLKVPDCEGVKVLRLIIPDKENRLPEQCATYPHSLQCLSLEMLYEIGRRQNENTIE